MIGQSNESMFMLGALLSGGKSRFYKSANETEVPSETNKNSVNLGTNVLTVNMPPLFNSTDHYDYGEVFDNTLGINAANSAKQIAAQCQEDPSSIQYNQDYREQTGYYDCSSLVSRVYDPLISTYPEGVVHFIRNGHSLDTITMLKKFIDEQAIISINCLDENIMEPGDIILYRSSRPEYKINRYLEVVHAAMYVGNGEIVEAARRLINNIRYGVTKSTINDGLYKNPSVNNVIVVARPSLTIAGKTALTIPSDKIYFDSTIDRDNVYKNYVVKYVKANTMSATAFVNKANTIAQSYNTLYVHGGRGYKLDTAGKNYVLTSTDNPEDIMQNVRNADSNTYVFDDTCLIKSILWGWGSSFTDYKCGVVYKSNNVPDENIKWFKDKCYDVSSDFSNMSNYVPGMLLFGDNLKHIGIYIGSGLAVEANKRSIDNFDGVAITSVNADHADYRRTDWDYIGKCPFIEY